MRISGCSALVTGGASGLGLATVRELLAAGAHVVLIDLPSSGGRDVAAELGSDVSFAATDVCDEAQIAAAIASVPSPLRIVVNCAGVGTPGKVLSREGTLPLADFERVIRVNLIGTFNVIRLASAAIAATEPIYDWGAGPTVAGQASAGSTGAGSTGAGTTTAGLTSDVEAGAAQAGLIGSDTAGAPTPERGVIVNTASVAAFDGQIGQPAYAASKGGIVSMTLPIARELASHLIRVMAIAPGIFDTPMLAALPEAARESLGAQVPHPARLGHPSEFAVLVRHIVENPMLNGEVIRLDGAIRMQPR